MTDEGIQAHIDALAARVQALTAERDELRTILENADEASRIYWEGLKNRAIIKAERDAARAELAAANARCAELEGEISEGFPERDLLYEQNAALQATLDRVTAALNRVDWWHHPGVWNDTCPGRPTRLHWTRPGQLEAKCRDCGFALVGMDADGEAIRAALTPEGKP